MNRLITSTASLIVGVLMPWQATAQAPAAYPDRPVKIIVGFAPGGSSDVLARLSAQSLSKALNQSFIVENRSGATGNIAHEAVAKAPPDGYTLLFATTDVTLNGATAKDLRFDPERDFAPVTLVTFAPLIMFSRPGVGGADLKEFIAHLKAGAGKHSYASTGRGTTTHLAAEQFKLLAQLDTLHVPYKGAAPAITAVLSSETEMLFTTHVSAKGQLDGGRLRALAIASSARAALLPSVPTFTELGYPIEFGTWFGMLAPAGTPPTIVNLLYNSLHKASQTAEFRDKIIGLGGEMIMSQPDTFKTFVGKDVQKWKVLVKSIGNADLK